MATMYDTTSSSSLSKQNPNSYPTVNGSEAQRELNFLLRQNDFKRRWDYYQNFGIPRPLKRKRGQPDYNVRANYIKLIVEKAVSTLFGKELDISLDGDSLETSQAEEWLNEVWNQNKKMSFLQDLAFYGALYGHCFVQISLPEDPPVTLVPSDENPDEFIEYLPDYPSFHLSYPRLIALDPCIVDIVAMPDDKDVIQKYIIEFPRLDAKTNKMGQYRKLIQRKDAFSWKIIEQAKFANGGWLIIGEADWPYPFAPIVDCQNLPAPGCLFGQADIDQTIIDLNNTYNGVISNLNKIVGIHSSPKTWTVGVDAEQIDFAVDGTISLQSKEAKIGLLETTASGIPSIQSLADKIEELIYLLAHTPEVNPEKVNSIGALSGVALEILYQPLIERTEQKRLRYGHMIVEVSKRLLAIQGYTKKGYSYSPRLTWPDLLPVNIQAVGQWAQTVDQLGLASKQTLAAKFGLNYSDELDRMKVEAQQKVDLIKLDQSLAQEDVLPNVRQ